MSGIDSYATFDPASCPLMVGVGAAGGCDWCGAPLTGRRTRWCSDECCNEFGRQHAWTAARGAALVRDKRSCVRCGSERDPDGKRWRGWLQVNHIDPRVGRGYGFGCHNHLSNLETLCHPCHVDETNRQRRERESAEVESLL